MSLESHRGGLFIVVNNRKRDRSPSSEREESRLPNPSTPPATETERRRFDADDWGMRIMREWGDNNVSVEIQEPNSERSPRPWAHDDDALVLVHQDRNSTSNFPEDYFSKTVFPLAMSTVGLSAEDSYNIGTEESSELLTLSQEDIEDIANAADVTTLPVRSDDKPAIVQQAPARDLQSGGPDDPEDEGSTNLPNGHRKHHSSRLSEEERCVESSS